MDSCFFRKQESKKIDYFLFILKAKQFVFPMLRFSFLRLKVFVFLFQPPQRVHLKQIFRLRVFSQLKFNVFFSEMRKNLAKLHTCFVRRNSCL